MSVPNDTIEFITNYWKECFIKAAYNADTEKDILVSGIYGAEADTYKECINYLRYMIGLKPYNWFEIEKDVDKLKQ